MSIQEKNDSEKAKAITDNSNQEELEDKYDLLMGKKDSEFEEDYLTFDQNKETQKNNPNQENNEEKNNALAQKDKANKDNSNQEEIENCIEDRVKKNNEFYKEVYTYNQEKEVKGKNAEENKSEISEAKSTGEDSMIVEEKKSVVVVKGEENFEVINKNPGETKNNFSFEKKALNSSDNQIQNKELNLGASPKQPGKPNNENMTFYHEEENNYDSESCFIGNKIKRENDSQEQSESSEKVENNSDYSGIESNKDNSSHDMTNSDGDDLTENQINESTKTASNRKRFNTELPQRVNESDSLTRDHDSFGLYQQTCYTESSIPLSSVL